MHYYTLNHQISEDSKQFLSIRRFTEVLELLGYPSEDYWMLYLDSKEYEACRMYKRIKRLLRDRKHDDVRDILPNFESESLAKWSFIKQFIARVKVKVDREISNEDAVKKLLEAIRMSTPMFDESRVAEYRLTYNEFYVISDMASRIFETGEKDRAINLVKSLIKSRVNSRTSEEDRATLFPAAMSNLSTMLGRAGKYKESLKICNEAIEICREYNNMRFLPGILHNKASCLKKTGEEEHVYKTDLIRAYHCAYAMGDNEEALYIKKDAEEDFGIIIA